ncbi:MAG TPA: hypothetical protein VG405_05320 [Solirubrobacteraceae bacterium]|jgi:hypothetical protein|nr:hypothetical protein [Solirubrobacteraceae bacterium]
MAAERPSLDRPAFYALARGGWRDLVTLLHPPYTLWHLSYVAFGAAAARTVHSDRLGAALGAFFLAVGVSAHALDELNGRPLGTALRRGVLVGLSVVGLAGAVAIGVAGVIVVSPLLVPLVLLGGFLVVAYNLELAGGRFHTDFWFAVAWGGFPAFTGYFVQNLMIRPAGLLVAAGCCVLSAAQRRLSQPVRQLRRSTMAVSGEQRLANGSTLKLTKAHLAAPLEGALSALSVALVLLAVGLIVPRL